MMWVRDNFPGVVLIVAGLVIVMAFTSLGRARGPVESPSDVRVPYDELRRAFSDMPDQDFARMLAPWESLVRDINTANRFTYEAIRNPLIQYQGIWVHGSGGVDTATITWEREFKDTTYRVAVTLADSIETGNNESAVWSIMNKTTTSCFFTGVFVDDSVPFDIVAVGLRK